MAHRKRVLVIGAGASGLTAIKACREECLDVICYEKTNYFGGRWRYTDQCIPGSSSVMKSTVCKASKEMEAFSDFPPPPEFPNFLHHTKMLRYLTMYAEKFDLLRHVNYQREVVSMVPSPEFEKSGRWSVVSVNKYNDCEETAEFDAVFVCTGRLSEPFIPSFHDQNSFTGNILHAQSLKSIQEFEDQKVLVVGNGNSGVEASVDISTVAQKVYLSTRSGFWLFPKVGPKGLPYDAHVQRRSVNCFKNICSDYMNSSIEKYLETKINHEAYKIKPCHRALDKVPTTSDDLPDKILTGRITMKGNISKFQKNGVIFEQEDDVTEVNSVILATGYSIKLPFLKESYFKDDGVFKLYKWVFPMHTKHSTVAFIGFVKSNGPQLPISESQSRWAARVFAKKLSLPSEEAMDRYCVTSQPSSVRNLHEIAVKYVDYMDELAEEYGVKPNIYPLLFKDSKLFWACFTGPFLSYQYRLVGPNKLNNARDFILSSDQRVRESFSSDKKCIVNETK